MTFVAGAEGLDCAGKSSLSAQIYINNLCQRLVSIDKLKMRGAAKNMNKYKDNNKYCHRDPSRQGASWQYLLSVYRA